MFEFTGKKEDFDDYIESKGLSLEHGKNTVVKYHTHPPYYENSHIPKYQAIIDPKKIVGFSRDEFILGETIYNNIFHLVPGRYERLLSTLEESTDAFREMFTGEWSMKISAYHLNDTDEYIICSDGNHRGSLAACLGLSEINIDRIYDVVCNPQKKERYIKEQQLRKKYRIENMISENCRYKINMKYKERLCTIFIDQDDIIGNSFEESLSKVDCYLANLMKRTSIIEKLPKWIQDIITDRRGGWNYYALIEGKYDKRVCLELDFHLYDYIFNNEK